MSNAGSSIRLMALFAIVIAAAHQAQAVPITFTHEFRASGTLDGVSFPMSDIVITASGDTDDRVGVPEGWLIPHTSASISIANLTFDLLGTQTAVNNNIAIVRLTHGWPADTRELMHSIYGDTHWDMLTSLGPVSCVGELMPPMNTTGGALSFDHLPPDFIPVMFTAIVVPEPATILLLGLGVLMLKRRK